VTTVNPPLKWHGGKTYLARRIIALMPPHIHYVEPYFGGGAVLLAKDPEGVSEVVNDLNRGLINFWSVLRDEGLFDRLRRYVEAMPFSEDDYKKAEALCGMAAFSPTSDQGKVRLAAEFFVACRQSLAGRMKSFTGVTKTRVRRGMNNEVSAWLTAVEGLPAVHARLKRVLILNRPALEVIRGQDGPDTLFYLDPPYLHETRATTADYAHEMTAADHERLLATIAAVRGKFILSGYRSELYDRRAESNGWRRIDIDIPNHAAGGDSKRRMTECLWLNYDPPEANP